MQKKYSNSVKIYYPEYSREQLIKLIKGKIKLLNRKLPVEKIILFGSYAKGNYTVASDIDLLVIYSDPKNERDYSICWEIIDLPMLELHIYTKSEYEKLKLSGSKLPTEIEKHGITIWTKKP